MPLITIKKMRNQSKIGKHIYVFDFMFILIYISGMYLFTSFVHDSLSILYSVFNGVVALILTRPSPYNPDKRIYNSLHLMLIRDKRIYHPISLQKEAKP